MKRRASVTAVLAVALLVLTGCGAGAADPAASPTQRPVTQDEAERLAVARFTVYDQQWVDVDARIPVEGELLELTGRADMRAHAATAVVQTGDGRWALLQWTQEGKAVVPLTSEPDGLPEPPADGWQTAPLNVDLPLDAALAVILDLASDRPENPLLLRQNGARWVRSDDIGGTRVDVFLAPGADEQPNELVRYWVDDEGMLRRVVADTGGSEPLTVTLSPGDPGEVLLIPFFEAPQD